MQSLKPVPAFFLYKQIFKRKLGLTYFFNCFLAAPQPTLGYYRGDHPHQSDFDPQFTGDLFTEVDLFQGSWCASGQNCRKSSDYDSVSEAVPSEMS